jgi:AAA15 family ATPase/GTPase
MIISFEVQNFRSIYNPIRLDMLPSKMKGTKETEYNLFEIPKHKLKVLKSAVIFGANASGKSNILKAFEFFEMFILNSIDLKLNQKIPFNPFRLFRVAENEPSVFTMEFLVDASRYEYSFSIDDTKVCEEYLISYSSRKPSEIFSRKHGESIKFNANFKGEKKSLESQLLDNQLLLTKGANNKFEPLMQVYEYFQKKFNVFTSDFSDHSYSLRKSYEDDTFRKEIVNFLQVADTGIEDFFVKKVEVDQSSIKFSDAFPDELKSMILENKSYQTSVSHVSCEKEGDTNHTDVLWPVDEESDGTQKLLAIAGPIIDILKKGSVLIFDEINNSLHPLISRFLVETFNNPENNPNGAQLIFTTHDVTLLDNELFRRDQIWLVEKNRCGFTDFQSLCGFELRKDVPLEKWYLSGRFGALPIITDFKIN